MSTAKIDPLLKKTLRRYRDNEFDLLLRVAQVNQDSEEDLAERGVAIRQRIILTPAYAVTCTGQEGLELLDLPWVCRIDQDQRVCTH